MSDMNSAVELYNKGMDAVKRYDIEGYREAETFLKEAIEAGSVEAMLALGKMYCGIDSPFKEEMVDQTDLDADDLEEEGVALIEKAAEAGLLEAQIEAALIFDGSYTHAELETDFADDDRATKWYEAAALAGDADCAGVVGGRYKNGTGVKQNFDKARCFLELAVSKESDVGVLDLAEMYIMGLGTVKDVRKGVALLMHGDDSCGREFPRVVSEGPGDA